MIHSQLHVGHTPRVSNVFHTVPQPLICGVQTQRLDGVGRHWHFGQKISVLLIRETPGTPLL
jgi:hypothetical protein